MLLKLAWRNIWRNRRRTFITMASVFFAVLLAVLMRSANTGIYDHMVHNVVSFSSGYIQIHKKGYWDEQSIENSFREDDNLYRLLRSQPELSGYAPRLESFALASVGEKTKGVFVLGIDPEKETRLSGLKSKITGGHYIGPNDRSVLLAEGLAGKLGLSAGDTIVLISQGYHGASAAGKYPVAGIIRYGSPELNKRMVNMPLKLMQEMYGADGMITSISLMLRESDSMEQVKSTLTAGTDREAYEIMDWKQMMPELNQVIEGDKAGDYIVIGILYLVIAFGVFGTILMMTRERMHEFGILLAIGMKKRLLASVLVVESFLISFIAALAGMAGAVPFVVWFYKHPIRFSGNIQKIYDRYGMEAVIPFSPKAAIFTEQGFVIFVLSLLLSLYASRKIFKTNALEALRS